VSKISIFIDIDVKRQQNAVYDVPKLTIRVEKD
jgi:hypothetical protein